MIIFHKVLPSENSLDMISQDDERKKLTNVDEDFPDCPICLQTCFNPVKLPCSHVFCFLCAKGLSSHSKKCAMCRTDIPDGFCLKPKLLLKGQQLKMTAIEGKYQWFYEGTNGWWQFDDQASLDLESGFQDKKGIVKLLIAGFVYVVDLMNMVQYRETIPSRRRKIKRDLISIPNFKGIAGLSIKNNFNRIVPIVQSDGVDNSATVSTVASTIASISESVNVLNIQNNKNSNNKNNNNYNLINNNIINNSTYNMNSKSNPNSYSFHNNITNNIDEKNKYNKSQALIIPNVQLKQNKLTDGGLSNANLSIMKLRSNTNNINSNCTINKTNDSNYNINYNILDISSVNSSGIIINNNPNNINNNNINDAININNNNIITNSNVINSTYNNSAGYNNNNNHIKISQNFVNSSNVTSDDIISDISDMDNSKASGITRPNGTDPPRWLTSSLAYKSLSSNRHLPTNVQDNFGSSLLCHNNNLISSYHSNVDDSSNNLVRSTTIRDYLKDDLLKTLSFSMPKKSDTERCSTPQNNLNNRNFDLSNFQYNKSDNILDLNTDITDCTNSLVIHPMGFNSNNNLSRGYDMGINNINNYNDNKSKYLVDQCISMKFENESNHRFNINNIGNMKTNKKVDNSIIITSPGEIININKYGHNCISLSKNIKNNNIRDVGNGSHYSNDIDGRYMNGRYMDGSSDVDSK